MLYGFGENLIFIFLKVKIKKICGKSAIIRRLRLKASFQKHKFNIYLAFFLIALGIILKLNKDFSVLSSIIITILNHFVAFFLFPIFIVTLTLFLSDFCTKDRKTRNFIQFWFVVIAIYVNVFLSVFWEIDVQKLQTSYQIVVDFIATILSFSYLYWFYNVRKKKK